MTATHPDSVAPPNFWPPVFAALAAMFVGIGLARFAYTPLLPAIVSARWFSAEQAAYLGAANLAGYLAGAISGHPLARAVSTRAAARYLMALTAVSFVCCAEPVSFAWFSLWRFASGFTGGALMVIAAPSVLRKVPPHRRGVASGFIFSGVGLGIAAAGTLTPLLLSFGIAGTWLAYGAIAGAVTLAAWRCWPADPPADGTAAASERRVMRWPPQATAVVLAYALIAAGLVPHMVFLVDYVARALNAGIATGAAYWVLFGLGALLGPPIAGLVADRTGFGAALYAAIALQIAAVACILVASDTATLTFSSLVIGAFVPGNVPLVLGRTQEIFTDARERQSAWSIATILFAIGQAASAYLMSWVFAATGGAYAVLFGLGALALAAALLVQLIGDAATRLSRQASNP